MDRMAGDFMDSLVDSLIHPKALPLKAKSGWKEALRYFAVVLVLACILSTMIQTVPVIVSVLGGGSSVDETFKAIPDFKIINGTFILVDNVTQPYVVSESLVIDTTGGTTEVPLDKSGRGMLITSDAIIQKDGIKEERTYFKDLGGTVNNKSDFMDFMSVMMITTLPFIIVFAAIFNFLFYLIVCGFCTAVFVGGGLLIAKYKKTTAKAIEYIAISLYAQTPILLIGTVAALVSGIYLSVVGIVWAGAVFAKAIKADKNV
jgi:hypothetical protein